MIFETVVRLRDALAHGAPFRPLERAHTPCVGRSFEYVRLLPMKRTRAGDAGGLRSPRSSTQLSREGSRRSPDGNGDANTIELAARESSRTRDRPAAAGPREWIRNIYPEEGDVDEPVHVNETARDQVAVLLPHRHAVQIVEREVLDQAVVARQLFARDAGAGVHLAANRRIDLRAHVIARLLDRTKRRNADELARRDRRPPLGPWRRQTPRPTIPVTL